MSNKPLASLSGRTLYRPLNASTPHRGSRPLTPWGNSAPPHQAGPVDGDRRLTTGSISGEVAAGVGATYPAVGFSSGRCPWKNRFIRAM